MHKRVRYDAACKLLDRLWQAFVELHDARAAAYVSGVVGRGLSTIPGPRLCVRAL